MKELLEYIAKALVDNPDVDAFKKYQVDLLPTGSVQLLM